jgi:hypothetical protein
MMPFVTLHHISLSHLLAMASGTLPDTLTDIDFLETLAAKKCFIVPPHVVRAEPTGTLTKITSLIYTTDGNLDKPRILLETARQLRRIRQMNTIGKRFTV